MKRLLAAGSMLALVGLGLRAVAQGYFFLDTHYGVTNRVDIDSPGNRYSGTFWLELWMLNSADLPAGLNLVASQSGVAAYQSLSALGFLREQTFVNQSMDQGQLNLGTPLLGDAPGGTTLVVALAAWNTSAPSWAAMLAGANASTRAGLIAFVQPVTDPAGTPEVPAAPLAWGVNQDLVMLQVPEPGVLGLVGLGAALLLWRGSRC